MVRVYTDVEVDFSDVLAELSDTELTNLVAELLDDGHVPFGWSKRESVDLSDGAVLLDVILELRKLGYTVEPGGK